MPFFNKNIYIVDGKNIDADSIKKVLVFYYDAHAEKSIEIGSIQLKFITQKQIFPEIKVLYHVLSKHYEDYPNRNELVISDIQSELNKFYGKVEQETLIRLITNN